jgi:hypothetical protein
MTSVSTLKDLDALINGEGLFARELTDDPWVAFHGTTSSVEEQVDREGFRPTDAGVDADSIDGLCRVFSVMRWPGRDQGGYVVLGSFSKSDSDWMAGARPTYFAETPERAALYATRDFSGGEVARAVRKARHDLLGYLSDESIPAEHEERQRTSAINALKADIVPVGVREAVRQRRT